MRHFICLSLIIFSLTGCKKEPLVAEKHSEGERYFRSNCQSCHILPRPSLKTDEEWPALVARYGEKAKLSPEAIRKITGYLVASN